MNPQQIWNYYFTTESGEQIAFAGITAICKRCFRKYDISYNSWDSFLLSGPLVSVSKCTHKFSPLASVRWFLFPINFDFCLLHSCAFYFSLLSFLFQLQHVFCTFQLRHVPSLFPPATCFPALFTGSILPFPTTFYGWHAYRHLSAKIIFPLFLFCFLIGSLSSNLYREWFCLWKWRTFSCYFQASLETVPSFRSQIAVKLGTWGWLRCCVLPFLIVLFVIKLGVEGALPLNLRKDWPAESYIQDYLIIKNPVGKEQKNGTSEE